MQSLLGQSCLQYSLDLALFCWNDKDGNLAGMIVLHVNDFYGLVQKILGRQLLTK